MSIFPSHIFKAYDIRGLADSELSVDLAQALGFAFVSFLKEELGDSKQLRIVAARDMRISSPELHAALIEGLKSAGATVLDIGLASTPSFYFATTEAEADGGIIVSASHNPAEYNGFKVVRKNGVPVSGISGMDHLRDLTQNVMQKERQDVEGGSVEKMGSLLEKETAWTLSQTDVAQLPKLKIVADTANAMGAQYVESLFKEVEAELVAMNFELDGTFPAHEADPFKDENVADLQKRIVEEGADMGIATDGDGDRIFFFDEKGQRVEPSVVRAILSENMLRLHPGAKICYDIRPGKITPEKITEAGGQPVVTKVGHSLIKEKSIEIGAAFAGESSGHMFFWYKKGFFEVPMLAVVKFLEEVARSGKKVSEMADPYRKYFHSGEINFKVKDSAAVFSTLKETFEDGKINDLDGVSVEYDDYWFNVRGSNTEPKVRLNMEAVSEDVLESKVKEVSEIIKQL